ncbi:MAG: hypothetical protein M1836_004428 [Candelina mexicana]|nr:MAG: hypothetical protein M1836_004428 [Candelina mexicana]
MAATSETVGVPPEADLEKVAEDPLTTKEDDTEYPSGRALALIIVALMLAVFLVALDRTIIGTAIPRITDQFHSVGDVGWYGSAYLITASAFQLLFGRIYTFYSPKWVFLAAIGLFEVGSVVCAAAPTSTAFIIGRAIAGLGAAGIFSGGIIIIVHTVPLPKRPMFQGMFGGIFGIASICGPLIGGVFTTKVSWRWCFYINLPIGAVTVAILILILKLPNPTKANTPFRQQLAQLDPIGTLFFLPSIVCLLLALQWGGTTYTWSNGRIIALLVLFGVLFIAFVGVQIWKQELATVPPRIFRQRSIAAGVWYTFCVGGSMITLIYFLPIWFQAIKDVNAVQSGIRTLPLVLSLVVAAITGGSLVTRFGYYTPFMLICSTLTAVGAGMLTTLKVDSGRSKWIGYQVLYGLGLGCGMQQGSVAAQTVLSKKDASTGASLMLFAQGAGGSIALSIANNLFASHLSSGLGRLSGLDATTIVNTGATELRTVINVKDLGPVLVAYNAAVTKAFQVALALSCIGILGALLTEWKSVKKAKQPKDIPGTEEKKAGDTSPA